MKVEKNLRHHLQMTRYAKAQPPTSLRLGQHAFEMCSGSMMALSSLFATIAARVISSAVAHSQKISLCW
jgi:hypothetical protein